MKNLPKSKGPISVLVFNQQGLPVFYLNRNEEMSFLEQERKSAFGLRMVRELFNSVRIFHNQDSKRLMFFYDNEVISIEQEGPFVILVTWPSTAFKEVSANSNYIKRLRKTLYEELT
ncbi:MAG: hypothetical protein P9M15_04835 [Candidatus Electryoneaceae bacterium]|nr:hypothetical protein [Candidatus Electryoneaceae bacterium]